MDIEALTNSMLSITYHMCCWGQTQTHFKSLNIVNKFN